MKILNSIIERYGIDKMLHFLVGALITAMASIFGLLFFGFVGFMACGLISILLVFVLSYIKERKLDDFYDPADIKAAMLGTGVVFIVNILMFGINAIIKGY